MINILLITIEGELLDAEHISCEPVEAYNLDYKSMSTLFVTAGGKIVCARCAAKSKRSGEQCKKPALRGKAVCDFHGGRSTGPRTQAGKARQRAAVTKTGAYTKQAAEDRASSMRVLHGLEDAMYVLKMTTMPRTRGRKPSGYAPLQTVADVVKFALDNPLHRPECPGERQKK
jgi:hypothetical protein